MIEGRLQLGRPKPCAIAAPLAIISRPALREEETRAGGAHAGG
jgi:hypothetical protein